MTVQNERPLQGDLEFPFHQEELYGGATEDAGAAWHARLVNLGTETPFLSPFQTPEDSRISAVAPETFEEETPEREDEYQTAPDNPTADAFIADADGKAYFTTFPQVGDLTINKATVQSPPNFENLMDHMLSSKQKNFVIDAHGDPSGLSIHLARGTRISATKRSFFILRGIERIRTLMRLAKESNTIWERAPGMDLDKWRRIVETLHSKTWQKMIGPSWLTETPQVSSVDAARSVVQSRISALLDALFPGGAAG
jgi:hypothetical protein